MTTTSRGIALKCRPARPSHTPGKDKGERCTKSELKEWGRSVDPYKLSRAKAQRYLEYTQTISRLNSNQLGK